MTGAEATASYPQVPAIPDVNIVLGEADATAWPRMPNLRIAVAEASSSSPCAAMPV